MLVLAAAGLGFMSNPEATEHTVSAQRRTLALRHVGHQLLRAVGDSTTAVPPVWFLQADVGELTLTLPHPLMPDSLAALVSATLQSYQLTEAYQVGMHSCEEGLLVYGYEHSLAAPDEISCLGREVPMGCYTLRLTWLTPSIGRSRWTLPLWALSGLAVGLVGLLLFRQRKPTAPAKKRAPLDVNQEEALLLGDVHFFPQQHELRTPRGAVELSHKETKVLGILFAHLHEVVSRDQLLKEGWEDEGTYTSRSLDMFISKLRKKLAGSATVQIVTVRGQGYQLTERGGSMS